MKLKDIIEQMTPATQSPDVKGIPKIMPPIVRRKLPAGYIEDTKKKKKRKIIIHEEEEHQDVDSYDSMTSKGRRGNSSYSNMGKAFDGTRPKYKPKTNFLFNKKRKKRRKVQEELGGLTQMAPYQDLEFLAKFWREGKGKENLSNVDKKATPSQLKRKEKVSKNKKKKPHEYVACVLSVATQWGSAIEPSLVLVAGFGFITHLEEVFQKGTGDYRSSGRQADG
jgi:hypothetical protein